MMSSLRRNCVDFAEQTPVFDRASRAMNSFIFEMIYCKRQAKDAPKAMVKSGDICTNHRRAASWWR